MSKQYNPANFENLQLIGSGSSGDVYKAYSKEHNLSVVIKVLNKRKNKESNILSEVSILTKLHSSCEKNIVCYVDFMEDTKNFYIIMEYLGEYVLLSDYIANKDITVSAFVKIAENLKNGMGLYHKYEVAHRDIKPDNIMINPITLDIKYIDFGFACTGDTCYDAHTVGTPLYYAPELLGDMGIVPKNFKQWALTDYWSLGLTILELILKRPFIDYYSEKLYGKAPEHIGDIFAINKILLVGGVTISDIEDCCRDFLKGNERLKIYMKMTLVWLLKGNPTQRVLILNKTASLETMKFETIQLVQTSGKLG